MHGPHGLRSLLVASRSAGKPSGASGPVSNRAAEPSDVLHAGSGDEADSDQPPAMVLFGRERELRSVSGWLDRDGPRGLVLAGEAGIGKTAIWRQAVSEARSRGQEVLIAAPAGAEVQLALVALADLLAPLGDRSLASLRAPQRRALEVALLRRDDPGVDIRSIGSALLSILRRLSAERPLLLGIDDLQWLDAASAAALSFALRRLEGAPVGVLATCRGSPLGSVPLDLERTLGVDRVARLEIGSLSLAAVHELLSARLDFDAPRVTLVALFEAADGNPFVAIELARELMRHGTALAPGVPLPVPPSVRELVAARIGRLPAHVRELLLAAAALARPTVGLLERLQPDAALSVARAVEEGVVDLGPGGRVRFSHPLLARVPYERLEPARRRRLHARLARVVDDAEERVRHSALAASRPNARVADELDRAAASAGARGLPIGAAELCMLAARLTPPGAGTPSWARLLAAAEWHERAGDIDQAVALAEELLDVRDADGNARALSLLGTTQSDGEGVVTAVESVPPGAAAARGERSDPGGDSSPSGTTEPPRGRRPVRRSARTRRSAVGPSRRSVGRGGRGGVRGPVAVARGRPLDRALLVPARALRAGVRELSPGYWQETAPEVIEAVTLLWAGELEQAQAPLEHALALAIERDEPGPVMHALAYMSSLAVGLGDLEQSPVSASGSLIAGRTSSGGRAIGVSDLGTGRYDVVFAPGLGFRGARTSPAPRTRTGLQARLCSPSPREAISSAPTMCTSRSRTREAG